MTAKRNKTTEIAIGLRIALSDYYRGVLATRLSLGLAKHYAGSASRLAHGELRDVVRGDRGAFTKAAGKVRTEDTNLREGAEEELRVVYHKLPRKLGVRLDERDVEAFWEMIDHALFPTLAAKKTEEVEVTKEAPRLWVAYRRGPVAVFSGAHAQGATRREAVASLAKMVASLRQEGRRLARQKWVRAIGDDKLREEVMRLVLARQIVDERDFNPRDRKRLAQLDAESTAALEAVRAGRVGSDRALRRLVSDADGWLPRPRWRWHRDALSKQRSAVERQQWNRLRLGSRGWVRLVGDGQVESRGAGALHVRPHRLFGVLYGSRHREHQHRQRHRQHDRARGALLGDVPVERGRRGRLHRRSAIPFRGKRAPCSARALCRP